MVIMCKQCGRPACEVDVPDFGRAESSIIKRVLSGFGVELDQLDAILNPTPESITAGFNVRCGPDEASRCRVLAAGRG